MTVNSFLSRNELRGGDNMKSLSFIIISLIASLILFNNCDQTTGPGGDINKIVQIPGCNSSALNKNSSLNDSCFTYQFRGSLIADFCVTGNCCPDKDRYSTKYNIINDTIFVAVTDTAERKCMCSCNYILHAEFYNLVYNHYLFIVYNPMDSPDSVLYSIDVRKN